MNDIVLNKFNEVTNRNTNSNQQTRDFSSSEETVFCSKCGAKVDKDTKFCPSCGEKLAPGAKFCAKCGTKVE